MAKHQRKMTCQICGRPIWAATGVIAHHGYERPYRGEGWQTASCPGARELPFEVSRERLAGYIEELTTYRQSIVITRGKIEREEIPALFSYSKPSKGGFETEHTVFTRESFAARQDEFKRLLLKYMVWNFDDVKKLHLARLDKEIKFLDDDIASQTKRFDGWKQTHHWISSLEIPQRGEPLGSWEKV